MGTWRRVTGLVGVVWMVACSGATTGGGERAADLSAGELRDEARGELVELPDSLVPASGGGWAFVAGPGGAAQEDPANWLYAGLIGAGAGLAGADDLDRAFAAATDAAAGAGNDRAAAFAVVQGLENPRASAVAPSGARDRLLAAAQVHIDAGDLDWIGVVAALAAGGSEVAPDAREMLAGLTGSEGSCADLDPVVADRELPGPGDQLTLTLSRLAGARITCPQALQLLPRLLGEDAWQVPEAAYDLTLLLRITPDSVERAAASERVETLARGWIDGPLVPLPAVYEARLLLAAAGGADAPVSDDLARRLRGQIATEGRLADFVDGVPAPADLVVEEQLVVAGMLPAHVADTTRQALTAAGPPENGTPAETVAWNLMVGKNLPSCTDAAVVGTGSPTAGGPNERIGAEAAAVVALDCSGVLDVQERLDQVGAETDYLTRAARAWAVAYTTCLLPDAALDAGLADDLGPVGPDRDQPFPVYARAFLADPAGSCAALAGAGILPTASA